MMGQELHKDLCEIKGILRVLTEAIILARGAIRKTSGLNWTDGIEEGLLRQLKSVGGAHEQNPDF